MRIERLFNVLVLGGAALGAGCGHDDSNDGEAAEPSTNAGSGSGGTAMRNTGGTAGTSSPEGGSSNVGGTSNGGNAGGGGAAASGGTNEGGAGASPSGGSPVGGTAGSNESPAGSGGAAGGGTGGDGGGGAAGSGGTGSVLECMLDAMGRGNARDPCGCPCCWATDCLNTDDGCCAGFCLGGDEGKGCCGP